MTSIVAISGSLRDGSFNTSLIRALGAALPTDVSFTLVSPDDLRSVPPYDPELDAHGRVPESVERLREQIRSADVLVISTPEYNGSVPGGLKSVIDWASRPRGNAPIAGTSVAVMSASTGQYGGAWAQQDLARILGIAGARVLDERVTVAKAGSVVDDGGSITSESIRASIADLATAIVREAELAAEQTNTSATPA